MNPRRRLWLKTRKRAQAAPAPKPAVKEVVSVPPVVEEVVEAAPVSKKLKKPPHRAAPAPARRSKKASSKEHKK